MALVLALLALQTCKQISSGGMIVQNEIKQDALDSLLVSADVKIRHLFPLKFIQKCIAYMLGSTPVMK